MKQKRLFSVVLTKQDYANALANKEWFGVDYGFFFTTSGACKMERINPTAKYQYIWTTIGKKAKQ